MTDAALAAALGLAAGVALGGASHAGLWWTVRRAPRARRPGLLLALSALLRGAALLAGLTALAMASPWALAGAAVGVLLARTVAIRAASVPAAPARPRSHDGDRPAAGEGGEP